MARLDVDVDARDRHPRYLLSVFRSLCALVISTVLSGFAFLLVTGEYINDGPLVLSLSYNHGIHAGDLIITAGWATAMLAIVPLVTASGRRSGSG